MHPRTEQLLTHLDTHRAALLQTVEAVPVAIRDTSPGATRWSVAEVVEHLTLVEARFTDLLAHRIAHQKIAGLEPERDTSPIIVAFNWDAVLDRQRPIVAVEAVRPAGGLTSDAALAALHRSREGLRAVLVANDGLAWGHSTHAHQILGELTLYQWILFLGGHEARHAAQIREVADTLLPPASQAV